MRNQRRAEKIHLSPELEQALYGYVLKKREIDALKERCSQYQEGSAREWSGDAYPAYAQYFGALTALKVKSALLELEAFGYLKEISKSPVSIFDFGAGTLGASLGAVDFFKERAVTLKMISAYDRNPAPIRWAQSQFEGFLPGRVQTQKPEDLNQTLVVAVDVFNEMGLMDQKEQINPDSPWVREILSWIERATPSTLIVLIEPAAKGINRNFLTLRNLLKDRASLLLPCTHWQDCPALLKDDWCHEERDYKVPSAYWNLVRQLGFRRHLLQFSMLCFGKQATAFEPTQARVISRPIKSKGRCEKWLCASGKMWKASLLNRNRNEAQESFYDACRGDIIDCRSTGLLPPD